MTPRLNNARRDIDEHSGMVDRINAEIASNNLRDALARFFRKWENMHGFRPGAGQILVPAGYVPR